MTSLGMQLRFPRILRVENVGAIFMSENNTATVRTRHVDARYNFVREYIAEGHIKIIFVKTADNLSDGFTKNVTQEVYICMSFINKKINESKTSDELSDK